MNITIEPHDLTWQHGVLTDWTYIGGHRITRLSRDSYSLERLDDDSQPLVTVGFFDNLYEVLLVLNHDQKVEV